MIYLEPGAFTFKDLPNGMRKLGPQIMERIQQEGRGSELVYGVLDEVLDLIDMKLIKQCRIDAGRV